jgi:hypothetical protein
LNSDRRAKRPITDALPAGVVQDVPEVRDIGCRAPRGMH